MNIKSYLECLYDYGDHYSSIFKEVSERNPEKIFDDGRIIGCRFLDKIIINCDGHEKTIDSNFSNWIWFGEKYTRDEILKMDEPKYDGVLNYMAHYHLGAVCMLRNGGYQPLGYGNDYYDDIKDQMIK